MGPAMAFCVRVIRSFVYRLEMHTVLTSFILPIFSVLVSRVVEAVAIAHWREIFVVVGVGTLGFAYIQYCISPHGLNAAHCLRYHCSPSLAFSARSCSRISLLQYRDGKNRPGYKGMSASCRCSSSHSVTYLRHPISMLSVRAHAPRHRDYTEHDRAHDGGVGFPIRGLRVPASGGRPDVFGVAMRELWLAIGLLSGVRQVNWRTVSCRLHFSVSASASSLLCVRQRWRGLGGRRVKSSSLRSFGKERRTEIRV